MAAGSWTKIDPRYMGPKGDTVEHMDQSLFEKSAKVELLHESAGKRGTAQSR